MRIIGLTGGIACGKSTISLTLKSLGATIIDGDQLSRALTQPGGLALPAIRAEFGSEVFHADGTLDRRALGSLIFASDERRHALDDLMQPLLREMIEREILRAKEGGAKICVLDMPLLDTRRDRDLLGTFIADLVLQVLSFIAQNERENIRRRQAEGIAAARLRGIRFGREPRPLPRNFVEIYELWKTGAIPTTEAAKRCGMARSTFRYRAESIRKNDC